MQNAKKGLKLMTISIIIMMVYTVIYSILMSLTASDKLSPELLERLFMFFVTFGILGSALIQVITYVIAMVGLKIAGKDNECFKKARKAKLFSLILSAIGVVAGIVCVLAFLFSNQEGDAGKILAILGEGSFFVSAGTNVLMIVTEVIAFHSITKGCREIAPTVGGISIATYAFYIIALVLNVILPVFPLAMNMLQASGIGTKLITVVGYVETLASTAYSVLYIVLIFVTTGNIKKKEEPKMRTKLPR